MSSRLPGLPNKFWKEKVNMSTTPAQVCVMEFLSRNPSEWEDLFPLYEKSVNDMAYATDRLIENATMLDAYLEARGADGAGDAGHEEAIKAALARKHRVRVAIGYRS